MQPEQQVCWSRLTKIRQVFPFTRCWVWENDETSEEGITEDLEKGSIYIGNDRITRLFPNEQQFGLTSHIRRAAVSVPSNIVEGCARSSLAEYLRFLEITFGSAREVEYQLSLALRLGFGSPESYDAASRLADQTCRILNGLIRSLRKHEPPA